MAVSHDYLLPVIVPTILVVLATVVLRARRTGISRLPYPPGPKPRFLIGNLFDIPTSYPWFTYEKWGKLYGDVIHIEALGQHILVINSLNAATELLEKRAHIYSDRPTIPMVKLAEWDFTFGMKPHGERWRQERRLFHQHFRRDAIPNYHPIQLKKTHGFLRNLLLTPEDFIDHIKTLSAGMIMAVVYGYEIEPANDPFVQLAEDGVRAFSDLVQPGAFLVNTLPFLQYLPSWFPGCGFHQFARDTVKLLDRMKTLPFNYVRKSMRDGVDTYSVLGEILKKNDVDSSPEKEKMIKDVAGIAYAAAHETTASTLQVFFLAMAMHPDAVCKAQSEIGAVIGPGRLPVFEDRKDLPYCEAVFREVFRWLPTVPLALPHATKEDDVYEGYYIPAGTMVLPNIWAIVHDEELYPNSETFQPERFLNADGQLNTNERILGFGFGRRICAGRYEAEAAVWAAIVSSLAVFDFAKAKDEDGQDIEIEATLSDEAVGHPLPFNCSITPRSEAARRLIESMSDVHF
ncbi:cytochrome P450 [Favolaschia claudopus]|uniref:Cytochrome P450 n=1 Tax=Favolaschia claudopus TaxID=2862362 RepID=A0AAW0DC14_9AGAR